MKSKTETQGKITKMVSGADAIEIKATIPDAQIEKPSHVLTSLLTTMKSVTFTFSTRQRWTCLRRALSPVPDGSSAKSMTAQSNSAP